MGTLFSRDSIWNLKWSIWEWQVGIKISPKPTKTSKENMKRLGRLWDKVLDLDNGFVAVVEGTQNKRTHRETQRFYFSIDEVAENPSCYHVIDPRRAKEYVESRLIPDLKNRTWKPKPPRYIHRWCKNKSTNGGKWRDLYVPNFDDHIIAHMAMKIAMPAFTRGMHPNCCGSVPGRGIKHIVKSVSHWMQDDRGCRYFVKLDIRHFFDNIDGDKLMGILEKHIKDKRILWVFDEIIKSAPVACPVGYYTSPFFANLYLQDLDWYIEQGLYKVRRGKRVKWVRHYLRYMDDMLLIGTSRKDLYKAVQAIEWYLMDHYQLRIKDTWEIKTIGKHEQIDGEWRLKDGTYWCDIGGYKFCKDSTIMRDGIFLASIRLARKMFKQDYYTPHQCQSLVSRMGWSSHCDSQHFNENIKRYVNLKTTRRIISDVDKSKQRRKPKTA